METKFPALLTQIKPYFAEGETVEWIGQPPEHIETKALKKSRDLMFCGVFLCLLISYLVLTSTVRNAIVGLSLIAVPFAICLYALVWAPSIQKKARTKHYYVLTSHHIFFVNNEI